MLMISNVEKYIVLLVVIISLFWGFNRHNKASEYQSKYLKNEYILERIKTNHPETFKMIKDAKEEYLNGKVDALNDTKQGGLDN